MPFTNYKDASRLNWGSEKANNFTMQQINTGAILRIADATEKMAQYHSGLIRDLEYYKKQAREYRDNIDRLAKSNAALRGHLKRIKNRLESEAKQ